MTFFAGFSLQLFALLLCELLVSVYPLLGLWACFEPLGRVWDSQGIEL